jgi:O-antigen ligase
MERIATVLAIAFLGSLACNYSAWPASSLLCALLFLAAIESARAGWAPRVGRLLLLPLGYWAISFALTGESWSVFASVEFMRRDGALFPSLLAMPALAALNLDRKRMTSVMIVYFGVHAAVAVAGGISSIGGWFSDIYRPADLVDWKPTFFGLYIAHNATASVYLLMTLGALTWFLRPESHGRMRVVLFVMVALLAYGCILARSRGAFLALGAGAVFAVARALRRGVSRRVMAASIAGLAIALVAGGALLFPRFQRMLREDTDAFRRESFSRAWGHFKRSPIVGIGFGRYNDQKLEFSSIGIGEVATRAVVYNDNLHAHNSYLHWLAEGGAIGLAVMLAYWILVMLGLKGDDAWRDWILAGIVALAVLSLTEHYAGGGIYLMHLAFLIGVHQSRGAERLA